MRAQIRSKSSKHNAKKEFNANQRETDMKNTLETSSGNIASMGVTEEERHQLIADAAYFRAERRSFAPGGELEDWFGAETEVEIRLSQGTSDLIRRS
jgi:hypothetical protein